MCEQPGSDEESGDVAAPNTAGLARLDPVTWAFHPEPPSAVDAAVDRRARNHLAWSEMTGYLVLVLFVVALVPPVRELALVALLPMLLLVFPTAIVSVFRHRALRKITGAPVVGELQPVIQPTAEILAADHATFQQLLAMRPEDTNPATLAEARQIGTSGLKDQRKMARHLVRYFELAALYERWGWNWPRAHYVRKLNDFVLTFTKPRIAKMESDEQQHNTEHT